MVSHFTEENSYFGEKMVPRVSTRPRIFHTPRFPPDPAFSTPRDPVPRDPVPRPRVSPDKGLFHFRSHKPFRFRSLGMRNDHSPQSPKIRPRLSRYLFSSCLQNVTLRTFTSFIFVPFCTFSCS